MKQTTCITLLIVGLCLLATSQSAFAHVIPDDELRNYVFLNRNQALKQTFEGATRVKLEKKKVTAAHRDFMKSRCKISARENKIAFYSGAIPSGENLRVVIEKVQANSHPPTKLTFILAFQADGKIHQIRIMNFQGPQRQELISESFLSQFIGKSGDSDFGAVTSNQGPTLTVKALSQSVCKMTSLFKAIYLPNAP